MTINSENRYELDKDYLRQLWNNPSNKINRDWFFSHYDKITRERLIEKWYSDMCRMQIYLNFLK
jgi:hypothetical protein